MTERTLFNPNPEPTPPVTLRLFQPLSAGDLISLSPLTHAFKHTSVLACSVLDAGMYEAHPYAPADVLNTFLSIHTLHLPGTRLKPAKTKADVEAQRDQILGYTISSKMVPLSFSAAHVMVGPTTRINGMNLGSIQPDTLEKSDVKVNLSLKTDSFILLHAHNTFSLFALTSIPDRLYAILTAV